MRIAFYGDSLTAGSPGVSALRILEAKLPEHQLINRGRGGETAASLYRRILQEASSPSLNIAVVWIGVNDILPKLSLSHTLLKRVSRQPPARSLDEFRDAYGRMLQLLHRRAKTILTVTPFLIGEDVSNCWNRELEELSKIVGDLAQNLCAYTTLDLHSLIAAELAGRVVSDYVPKTLTRIALDVFTARSPHQVDALARKRGLHVTLDGVHLNTAGARWVASAILEKLEPLLS